MVASRIRCIVVEVPVASEPRVISDTVLSGPIHNRLGQQARELLPWADPYIARLIRNLQDEVRAERAGRRTAAAAQDDSPLRGEAPPPATCPEIEFELPTDEEWPLLRDSR